MQPSLVYLITISISIFYLYQAKPIKRNIENNGLKIEYKLQYNAIHYDTILQYIVCDSDGKSVAWMRKHFLLSTKLD